jgi:hypothetical protein
MIPLDNDICTISHPLYTGRRHRVVAHNIPETNELIYVGQISEYRLQGRLIGMDIGKKTNSH